MNAKFFVPFETAKLLKGKGYNGQNNYFWDANHFKPRRISTQKRSGIQILSMSNNEVYMLENNPFDSGCFVECTAPTYHEVVDWLDGKGICVLSYTPGRTHGIGHFVAGFIYNNNMDWCVCDTIYYPTREEALNAAILKALEMI